MSARTNININVMLARISCSSIPPNECRVPMLLPLDPWGTNTEGLTGCSRPCTHIPGPGGWGPDLLLFLRHSMVSAALVVLVRVRAWAWEREDLRFCYYCLAVRHICYIESKFFFCRLWINFLVFYIHEKHSSFFWYTLLSFCVHIESTFVVSVFLSKFPSVFMSHPRFLFLCPIHLFFSNHVFAWYLTRKTVSCALQRKRRKENHVIRDCKQCARAVNCEGPARAHSTLGTWRTVVTKLEMIMCLALTFIIPGMSFACGGPLRWKCWRWSDSSLLSCPYQPLFSENLFSFIPSLFAPIFCARNQTRDARCGS